MKRLLTAAAFGAIFIAAPAVAQAPAAAPTPEYVTIHLDTTVDAPIEKVWAKVGPYCAIQDWMKPLAPCVLVGDGGVGSGEDDPELRGRYVF